MFINYKTNLIHDLCLNKHMKFKNNKFRDLFKSILYMSEFLEGVYKTSTLNKQINKKGTPPWQTKVCLLYNR